MNYFKLKLLFFIFFHSATFADDSYRCVQTVKEKLFIEGPKEELEPFCGVKTEKETSDLQKIIADLGKNRQKAKSISENAFPKGDYAFNFYAWPPHGIAFLYSFGAEEKRVPIAGKKDCAGQHSECKQVYVRVTVDGMWPESDKGGTEHYNIVKKQLKRWCISVNYKQALFQAFYIEGCVSQCLLNGQTFNIAYKFYNAKPIPPEDGNEKTFYIRDENYLRGSDADQKIRTGRSFRTGFIIDNIYSFQFGNETDIVCDKHLKQFEDKYVKEVNDFLEDVKYQRTDTCYFKFGDENLCKLNEKFTWNEPSTGIIFNKPDMPPTMKFYLILAHNCTLSGSKIFQIFQIGNMNLEQMNEVEKTVEYFIKLESKPVENYAFSTLEEIEYLKQDTPFKSADDVVKEGKDVINYGRNEVPTHYYQLKSPTID